MADFFFILHLDCHYLLFVGALGLLKLVLGLFLLRLGIVLECFSRLGQEARMFLFHTLDCDLERLEFVAVAHRDRLKPLDFDAEFVDDSPGDHLLSGDPDARLLVIRFSEE